MKNENGMRMEEVSGISGRFNTGQITEQWKCKIQGRWEQHGRIAMEKG